MKQTATDWMFDQLWETPKDKLAWFKILIDAKEMEKQQHLNTYLEGDRMEGRASLDDAEQYYKQTYK